MGVPLASLSAPSLAADQASFNGVVIGQAPFLVRKWEQWDKPDVRSGNVKRVASAVGEGAIAIHLVHRALAEI